ncbi:type II secretion system F family protein [Nocardioides sp.]|uniref:type II secretion system F family protein n=1 Tax=Nocardioides sp. TaxID=35761 RepID=UPI002B8989C1|nr:type II secretion system F family protein [Nocardioides sp.]HSX67213.1 type II secretion system F family protein [Nocardioides sp.]
MSGWTVLAALATAAAVGLAVAVPSERRLARLLAPADPSGPHIDRRGPLRRFRAPLALLAGSAGLTLLDGRAGAALAVAVSVGVWTLCTRAEPPGVRREREAVRRGLPHVTRLLAVVLASGQSVAAALGVVAEALPGPASAPLGRARSSLEVGVPPETVWADLAAAPGLEPLGRAFARASESGARVVDTVARLAEHLAAEDRAGVEDRARTVGIRAAVPLGLCLLPAFLLLGIVPVVAAALGALRW